jgi:hypothetical protein
LPGDWRNQAVAAARDGLNEAGLGCVVIEDFSEMRDGVGQNIVSDERVRPYGFDDLLFVEDFSRLARQVDEHLHRLGLDADFLAVDTKGVEIGMDRNLADFEALHSHRGR